MRQKFRAKAKLLKGEAGKNDLTLRVCMYGDWSEIAKNYLREYKVGDSISIKIEPWESGKTEAVNNYFHLLLKIYLSSGQCSYSTFEELKMAVKMNHGCGVRRWGYLDKNNQFKISKDRAGVPEDHIQLFPIIKSWSDYTLTECVLCVDRLIIEMLSLGISIDDIKLEYEEHKRAMKEEIALKKEKEKAWKWTSMFVRRRECIETTGTEESGVCFTCGRRVDFQNMDAGHFLPGRTNSVLFDTKWIRGQCKECNQAKGGNLKLFRSRLVDLYGEDVVSEVENRRNDIQKMTIDDYNEIVIDMKARFKGLEV
jgi:hypothetical protein